MAFPDREKLEIQCQSTIQFNFGSICDEVKRLTSSGHISKEGESILLRQVRNFGNAAIRTCTNHIETYTVTRPNRDQQPNNLKG
jgi:hypothetical protein